MSMEISALITGMIIGAWIQFGSWKWTLRIVAAVLLISLAFDLWGK